MRGAPQIQALGEGDKDLKNQDPVGSHSDPWDPISTLSFPPNWRPWLPAPLGPKPRALQGGREGALKKDPVNALLPSPTRPLGSRPMGPGIFAVAHGPAEPVQDLWRHPVGPPSESFYKVKPKGHHQFHIIDGMLWVGKLLSCFVTERKHKMIKRCALYIFRNLEHTVLRDVVNHFACPELRRPLSTYSTYSKGAQWLSVLAPSRPCSGQRSRAAPTRNEQAPASAACSV